MTTTLLAGATLAFAHATVLHGLANTVSEPSPNDQTFWTATGTVVCTYANGARDRFDNLAAGEILYLPVPERVKSCVNHTDRPIRLFLSSR